MSLWYYYLLLFFKSPKYINPPNLYLLSYFKSPKYALNLIRTLFNKYIDLNILSLLRLNIIFCLSKYPFFFPLSIQYWTVGLAQLVKSLIVVKEIWGLILAYTKNWLVSRSNDKELSSGADVMSWNSLS